jgi:hypothetical protein
MAPSGATMSAKSQSEGGKWSGAGGWQV